MQRHDPAALLDVLRADPATSAIITDFDGTLSPIVEDPAAAGPIAGAVDALHALATVFGRVAVVSGRPVSFLRHRLEIDLRPESSIVLSGLYGLEWLEDGTFRTEEAALSYRPAIDEVTRSAEQAAPPGVVVERKGLSVTVHVRTAPRHTEWARAWAVAAASTSGLSLHEGRQSFELRPPVDVDKGTVVASLIEGRRSACFLGDDHGDLPAFDALDRLAASTAAEVVRVGVRSPEAPAELIERADMLVDGPEGSLRFLRSLLENA